MPRKNVVPPRCLEFLRCIAWLIALNGYSPSYREIGEAMGVSLKAVSDQV